MTPLDILKAARAKIERPENWGKGRMRMGASCYCALGAIAYSDLDTTPQGVQAADLLGKVVGNITHWNDDPTTSHSDVLKAFDRAIELAGQP